MACSVVAITLVMPNCLSGARPMVRTIVEQLGLVAIWPFQPRRRCWPGGEHQLRGASAGFRILHDPVGDVGGRRAVEMPLGGVAILLTGRAVARAEPGELEPGMSLQELDEMLAHHSGGAQYAHFDS